jgi:hypothetical protein
MHVVGLIGLRTLRRFVPDIHAEAVRLMDQDGDDPAWTPPQAWVEGWQRIAALTRLWMEGRPISDVAGLLLQEDPSELPPTRTHGAAPIPKAIAFIQEMMEPLARLAGGVVAMLEQQMADVMDGSEAAEVPLALSGLPLCIKYGCDSLHTLAWYRFGLRFRRPAHLLSKAFPLGGDRQEDSSLRSQVLELRQRWLRGEIQVPRELREEFHNVFEAIRMVVSTGSGIE